MTRRADNVRQAARAPPELRYNRAVPQCTEAVSLSARSSDTLITSRVKAALLDDKEVYGNAFKIVTERGVVYMMGRVTKREADYATTVVRGQSGVQKVVRVLETISEEELKQLLPPPESKVEPKSSPVMSGSGQPVMTTSPR